MHSTEDNASVGERTDQRQSGGSVGSGDYEVQQGDCISSIASRNGFFWETLWNHGENAELKQKRGDPNVLLEGDRVHIPELRTKEESGATEKKHRFKLKGVPAKMKLRLAVNYEALANKNYRLCIDGKWQEGTTDGDGYVEAAIPPEAQSGKIMVQQGSAWTMFDFNFGTVDPLDTDEGVRGRLSNMGFDAGTDLRAAVRAFQGREGLRETGEIDDNTRTKIRERFGQ